jgi:nucleoside-diphosphate-sugar epimerase
MVTGSSGRVGRAVAAELGSTGWSVRRFDLAQGDDLRDAAAVRAAAAGCDAIVHAGAIAHDTAGTPDDIVATNVLGTWHVLSAAEAHGVGRVVYFSSAQVFGFAEGEGTPAYLPVDDDHPLRAVRPYGMSKRLAEEMCAMWTARTGRATVVVRPVMILGDDALDHVTEDSAELGAFVHLDDVVTATRNAVDADITGHVRMTLCGPGPFDTSRAGDTLRWRPERSWPH